MSVWVLICTAALQLGVGEGIYPSAIANKSGSGSHCDGRPPSTGPCRVRGLDWLRLAPPKEHVSNTSCEMR